MDLDIPLKIFTRYLLDAAELDKQHPHLRQRTWLVQNFSFDDTCAHYVPRSTTWGISRMWKSTELTGKVLILMQGHGNFCGMARRLHRGTWHAGLYFLSVKLDRRARRGRGGRTKR
jgi:hypothetical protein